MSQSETASSKPVIRFRNYKPQPGAVPVEKQSPAPVSEAPKENESETGDSVGRPPVDPIKRELQTYGNNDDTLNIVPRKANWDLKNMVSKKLEKLERRTQLAIVDILREKLSVQGSDDGADD